MTLALVGDENSGGKNEKAGTSPAFGCGETEPQWSLKYVHHKGSQLPSQARWVLVVVIDARYRKNACCGEVKRRADSTPRPAHAILAGT